MSRTPNTFCFQPALPVPVGEDGLLGVCDGVDGHQAGVLDVGEVGAVLLQNDVHESPHLPGNKVAIHNSVLS